VGLGIGVGVGVGIGVASGPPEAALPQAPPIKTPRQELGILQVAGIAAKV